MTTSTNEKPLLPICSPWMYVFLLSKLIRARFHEGKESAPVLLPEAFAKCREKLGLILSNACWKRDQRFLRLRESNKAFHANVGRWESAVAVLELCGFERGELEGPDGGVFLLLDDYLSPDTLSEVLPVIQMEDPAGALASSSSSNLTETGAIGEGETQMAKQQLGQGHFEREAPRKALYTEEDEEDYGETEMETSNKVPKEEGEGGGGDEVGLFPCKVCKRRFGPVSLFEHERHCGLSIAGKKFNFAQHYLRGTVLEGKAKEIGEMMEEGRWKEKFFSHSRRSPSPDVCPSAVTPVLKHRDLPPRPASAPTRPPRRHLKSRITDEDGWEEGGVSRIGEAEVRRMAVRRAQTHLEDGRVRRRLFSREKTAVRLSQQAEKREESKAAASGGRFRCFQAEARALRQSEKSPPPCHRVKDLPRTLDGETLGEEISRASPTGLHVQKNESQLSVAPPQPSRSPQPHPDSSAPSPQLESTLEEEELKSKVLRGPPQEGLAPSDTRQPTSTTVCPIDAHEEGKEREGNLEAEGLQGPHLPVQSSAVTLPRQRDDDKLFSAAEMQQQAKEAYRETDTERKPFAMSSPQEEKARESGEKAAEKEEGEFYDDDEFDADEEEGNEAMTERQAVDTVCLGNAEAKPLARERYSPSSSDSKPPDSLFPPQPFPTGSFSNTVTSIHPEASSSIADLSKAEAEDTRCNQQNDAAVLSSHFPDNHPPASVSPSPGSRLNPSLPAPTPIALCGFLERQRRAWAEAEKALAKAEKESAQKEQMERESTLKEETVKRGTQTELQPANRPVVEKEKEPSHLNPPGAHAGHLSDEDGGADSDSASVSASASSKGTRSMPSRSPAVSMSFWDIPPLDDGGDSHALAALPSPSPPSTPFRSLTQHSSRVPKAVEVLLERDSEDIPMDAERIRRALGIVQAPKTQNRDRHWNDRKTTGDKDRESHQEFPKSFPRRPPTPSRTERPDDRTPSSSAHRHTNTNTTRGLLGGASRSGSSGRLYLHPVPQEDDAIARQQSLCVVGGRTGTGSQSTVPPPPLPSHSVPSDSDGPSSRRRPGRGRVPSVSGEATTGVTTRGRTPENRNIR
uniref:Uncharacterized protein n=1 Tax=Chromera velia CCMP2878 TaxID=1169474 RepID=A0A0G4FN34_9ALVE|eukprot:Cvel_17789.t1-p1 / transcript=Cvel_17789.t1 / gene=Cvel_17789 / organism=Chromera_velia_CCMP2878 / gene_product=hypothetical protein / transcript_product=hypothetical protein / location=Cvel_scaffold1439:24678-35808(+) / protein_length=1080 / sequence_SO=supercontig / SO=protein_coding / is_pseudo=false